MLFKFLSLSKSPPDGEQYMCYSQHVVSLLLMWSVHSIELTVWFDSAIYTVKGETIDKRSVSDPKYQSDRCHLTLTLSMAHQKAQSKSMHFDSYSLDIRMYPRLQARDGMRKVLISAPYKIPVISLSLAGIEHTSLQFRDTGHCCTECSICCSHRLGWPSLRNE